MTTAAQQAAALKRGKEVSEELGLSITSDELLTALGERTLRQDEFSRQMNAIQADKTAYHKQVDEWWGQKRNDLNTLAEAKARLERENAELKARRGNDNDDDDDDDDDQQRPAGLSETQIDEILKKRGFVTQDVLTNSLQQFQGTAIPLVAYLTTLGHQHRDEFGETLNQNELIKYCQEQNIQIDRGGYEQFVAGLRKKNAEKVRAEEIKQAEERGREAYIAELRRSEGPPDTVSPDMFAKGSPLRGLSSLNKDENGNVVRKHGPQQANALFGKLISQKQQVPVDGAAQN